MANPSRSRNVRSQNKVLYGWELEARRVEVRRALRCEEYEIKAIAEATGYSARQVARIARKMGIPPKFQKRSEAEKERIRELGRQGKSMNEIMMRVYGTGGGGGRGIAVARILDEAGIPRRHKDEIWPGDMHWGRRCKGNVK